MLGRVPVEQAGALPVDAMTALRGLDDTLHLQPGQSLLILGASGGVGHLALQLAKRLGVRVLAVASGPDGVALAKRLGADAAIDGHTDDLTAAARQFAPDGLDAALLTAGGPAAERALDALRPNARAAYPNGVDPAPKPRPNLQLTSYDGTPTPDAIARLLNGYLELREPGEDLRSYFARTDNATLLAQLNGAPTTPVERDPAPVGAGRLAPGE